MDLSKFLLERGAVITPTTRLNCQNPRLRQLFKDYEKEGRAKSLGTEVPPSPMTAEHVGTVRAAARQ